MKCPNRDIFGLGVWIVNTAPNEDKFDLTEIIANY